MPLYWLIDSRENLVTLTGEGHVGRADLDGWLDIVDGASLLGYRKLVDLGASTLDLTPEDMMGLGIRVRGNHSGATGPLALVLPPEVPDSFERLLGILAAGERPMRLFRSLPRARRWLLTAADG
jgi:hypothetical protein